jgi:mannose-6-phosphate isomerase-like protein (cupin superfamily)
MDAETVQLTNPVTGMALRILRSAAGTSGALLEMEAFYPAGSAVPPPHFHPRQEERFVILEGAMRAVVGGARRDLAAGESFVIPAGEVHSMWNPGPGSARVNWQVRPALRTQEFFAVVFALAARGQVNAHGVPGLLDLALLMPHFRPEIQVTSPPAWVQRGLFGLLAPLARALGRCPELRRQP